MIVKCSKTFRKTSCFMINKNSCPFLLNDFFSIFFIDFQFIMLLYPSISFILQACQREFLWNPSQHNTLDITQNVSQKYGHDITPNKKNTCLATERIWRLARDVSWRPARRLETSWKFRMVKDANLLIRALKFWSMPTMRFPMSDIWC